METEITDKIDVDATKENLPEEVPCVLEVINIEELAVDGICGVY
jgi:mycofactocin precursor